MHFRPRVFSRAPGCGARRGPCLCTRRKFGPGPGTFWRALWAFKANWPVLTGSLSAESEPCKTLETPHLSIFAPLLHSHAATVQHSLQAFPMGTSYACVDTLIRVWTLLMRASCARVCACVCLELGRASFVGIDKHRFIFSYTSTVLTLLCVLCVLCVCCVCARQELRRKWGRPVGAGRLLAPLSGQV